MSEIVRFTDAANLAFHAMIDLAEQPEHESTLREIAQRLSASEAHLSKVLQRLRKVGLVRSARGPSGGYQIARDIGQITFEEIYVCIEGPITPKFCLFHEPVCVKASCGLGDFVGVVNTKMKEFLAELTLKNFPKSGAKYAKARKGLP